MQPDIVEASRHPDFKEGDTVTGLLGVQEYAISDGKGISRADTSLAPLQTWVGGLGMPGLTAYFGLTKVAEAKEGDTVVVSAASGAVGQVVGQIGNIIGCRTVGIAGGPDKCNVLKDEFGFDAAVDYKAGNLFEDLKAACPDGIDVDFENVGGDIFDAVLGQMNPFGRVAVCGLISMYNATELPPGTEKHAQHPGHAPARSGLHRIRFHQALRRSDDRSRRLVQGRQAEIQEDIRDGGVETFPAVLSELYTGGNFGKLILKV